MILSKKYSVLFIAIQKTGTTSVEKVLQEYLYPHVASSTVKIKKRPNFKYKHNSAEILAGCPEIKSIWYELFKFSFVRNPWDLCVSHYFYRQREGHEEAVGTPFREWLMNDKKREPIMWQASTQYDCLTVNGKLAVDFIGRFENLQADFDKICKHIQIPSIQLDKHNTTEHEHYSKYYDQETKEYVFNLFKKDIDYFNYEF
tara:strand:- start:2129 stop:2731 length:603 start_codon:yes stop_codon:yes gene_type:complete